MDMDMDMDMTSEQFTEQDGWFPIARFSDIKGLTENERDFLEHVRIFGLAKQANQILPSGYNMPDFTLEKTNATIRLGNIIGLSMAVDCAPNFVTGLNYSDGIIVAQKVNQQ